MARTSHARYLTILIFIVSFPRPMLHLICFLLHPKHDDAIKRKHFTRDWPFARGIHASPVDSPHKASDAEL